MGRSCDIPRTATFAWSPSSQHPLITTGTRAGALDADFSSQSSLELWDVNPSIIAPSQPLAPLASVQVESKFFDIAWNKPTDACPSGVIAGALENGALQLWDAYKLREASQDASISKSSKHTGPIKTVRFNRTDGRLLATAGAKGELYVTDLTNIDQAFRLGANITRADDIECLDWNFKPHNILATGSAGGAIVVWDSKAKKDMMTFASVARRPISSICWDPNASTRLISATSSDQDPLIHVWDLRKAAEPEQTLRGHDLGVLSLAWCAQDDNLLLSCAKDNRTICWNPRTGQKYGDYQAASNWAFSTAWNPVNPDFFATASFDGTIAVQPIQNTNPVDQVAEIPTDGEDFFSQTRQVSKGPGFSLQEAPVWKKTRSGVSFGFGGKLVRFKTVKGTTQSQIIIEDFHVDNDIVAGAREFDTAVAAGELSKICQDKLTELADEEERSDWQTIQMLQQGKVRDAIREYLGTQAPDSAVRDGKDPDNDLVATDDDEASFAAVLAATEQSTSTTSEPFNLHDSNESDQDRTITSALTRGDFMQALDTCIAADRMSDAFMIATAGGQACIDKVQESYVQKQAQKRPYLRLVLAISKRNLKDIVLNADLADWKEVANTVCSFANDNELPDLCEALGDRLRASGGSRKDSSFCYLAGSNLPKVVKTWLEVLEEHEAKDLAQGAGDSVYAIHARSLRGLVEKVTVFREVTKSAEKRSGSAHESLTPLYAKYAEFGDLLASHGQLDLAAKYLGLLPKDYPSAEVLQQRIQRATQKQKSAKPSVNSRMALPGSQATQTPNSITPMQATGPYAPANPRTTSGPYQNQSASSFPYAPAHQQMTAAIPTAAPPTMPPPPKVGESIPRSGVNWNDTPDNFFKSSVPRRTTPGPITAMPNNVYSAPAPKPAALAPPPKVGQTSKPNTPLPTPGFERPPSAMSTSTYTPAQIQTPYPANMSSQPPSTYAPPPAQMAPRPYAPSPAQQNTTGSYGPPTTSQYPSGRSTPSAPPSNRYAPSTNSQPAAAAYPQRTRNGYGSNGPPNSGYPSATSHIAPPPTSQSHAPFPSHQPRFEAQQQPHVAPPPLAPPPRGPSRESQVAGAPPAVSISQDARIVQDVLTAEMTKVRSSAPAKFMKQVDDMQKRLDVLFGHLQRNDLLKPDTVEQLRTVCQHMQSKQWPNAQSSFETMLREKQESEGAQWMVGVKRLLTLRAATGDASGP